MLIFNPLRKPALFSIVSILGAGMRRGCMISTLSFLALGGVAPAQAQAVKIVRNDPGGAVENRLHEIAQLRLAGTRIEIRGECVSACTMLLGLPNTCVARSSRLGFHGPQSQYYGVSLAPDQFEYWSQVMADHYPAAMRAWFIKEARKTTMGVITISGSQAIKMGARACM